MNNDLVYRSNVIFELYKAALKKEITVEAFFKAREIVWRAQRKSTRSMIYALQTAVESIGQGAAVMSVFLDDAIEKINAQIERLEEKEGGTV